MVLQNCSTYSEPPVDILKKNQGNRDKKESNVN